MKVPSLYRVFPALFALVLVGGCSGNTASRKDSRESTKDASDVTMRNKRGNSNNYILPKGVPWKGAKDARVTVEVVCDPLTDACSSLDRTLDTIARAHGREVRVVYMDVITPSLPESRAVGNALLAVLSTAGRDAYLKFRTLIAGGKDVLSGPMPWMSEQEKQKAAEHMLDAIASMAEKVGADPSKVRKAVTDGRFDGVLAANVAHAIRVGLRHLPGVVVNGRALNMPPLKTNVERAVARALNGSHGREGVSMSGPSYLKEWAATFPKGARLKLDTLKRYAFTKMCPLAHYGPDGAVAVVVAVIDLGTPEGARLASVLGRLVTERTEEDRRNHEEDVPSHTRIVVLPFPGSPDRVAVHEAVQEVYEQKGPEAFLKFLGFVASRQGKVQIADLEAKAKELGVDPDRVRKAIISHSHARLFAKYQHLAMRMGVSSAPMVFLNGRLVKNPSLSRLRRLVRAELESEDEYLESHPNVKETKYHAAIMKTALQEAVWGSRTPF